MLEQRVLFWGWVIKASCFPVTGLQGNDFCFLCFVRNRDFFFPSRKRHQVAFLFFTHEIHTITRIFLVNLCPNRPFSSCWEMMFGLQLPFAASCRRVSACTKLRGEAARSPPTVNLFICSYSNHIFYYLYEIHCVIHFAGAANASRKALKNILFRNNFFCSHQGRVSFSGLSFLPAFSLAARQMRTPSQKLACPSSQPTVH